MKLGQIHTPAVGRPVAQQGGKVKCVGEFWLLGERGQVPVEDSHSMRLS